MPIGSYANLYYIAKELETNKPLSVLDLGIGLGMNGMLVRQYLNAAHGLVVKLTGVEIFRPYHNPVWDLYDLVVEWDILHFIGEENHTYDCILMTDVIEHFYASIGLGLLEALPRLLNPGGFILVSTPGVFAPQGAVNGNAMETHLSHWTYGMFPPGWEVVKPATPDHHGDETLIMKYTKTKTK